MGSPEPTSVARWRHHTAYILAQRDDGRTGRDYINAIKGTGKKNIVIDEYSWIQGHRELDGYLLTAVQDGKRIVITGTESISLEPLNYGPLVHRVDMVHTTVFPYDEYRRVYNIPHSRAHATNTSWKEGYSGIMLSRILYQ